MEVLVKQKKWNRDIWSGLEMDNLSMFHISTHPLFVLFASWYIHAEVKALACSRNQSEPEWEHWLSYHCFFTRRRWNPSAELQGVILHQKRVNVLIIFGMQKPHPQPSTPNLHLLQPSAKSTKHTFHHKIWDISNFNTCVIRHSALKITTGQRSLTVVKAFVTAEKLYQTVKMTASTKI